MYAIRGKAVSERFVMNRWEGEGEGRCASRTEFLGKVWRQGFSLFSPLEIMVDEKGRCHHGLYWEFR